jgi:hypothetical protein
MQATWDPAVHSVGMLKVFKTRPSSSSSVESLLPPVVITFCRYQPPDSAGGWIARCDACSAASPRASISSIDAISVAAVA